VDKCHVLCEIEKSTSEASAPLTSVYGEHAINKSSVFNDIGGACVFLISRRDISL
jgi:hypothetical protein